MRTMRIGIAVPGHLKTVPMGRYCTETFRGMGHEVLLFDAGSLTLAEKAFLRPVAKMRGKRAFEKTRLNRRLSEAMRGFQPDFFLAIFGFDLFPETVAEIRRRGARTACWWLNDPFQFERGAALAPPYDFFFTNCARSAARHTAAGLRAAHLAHAAFPTVHRPISLSETERAKLASEVCFLGDWGPVRQGILSQLSRKISLRIWGPWRKHLTPRDRLWGCVEDGYFTPEQMARILSAAKVAINLHSWFGYYESGLNPRTFETPACGAAQVCDWKSDLEPHFVLGREIATYRTGEEIEGLLRRLLEDEAARAGLAQSGFRRVLAEHTYRLRMERMLNLAGF
ncbi:MAG: glycosyltransferase [Verrucomicrobiae bacterium]|nr:glycosyltransferase [Verrucomicrobiae bacterium]